MGIGTMETTGQWVFRAAAKTIVRIISDNLFCSQLIVSYMKDDLRFHVFVIHCITRLEYRPAPHIMCAITSVLANEMNIPR